VFTANASGAHFGVREISQRRFLKRQHVRREARSGHRDRGGGVAVDSESAGGLIVAELDVLISGSGCTSRVNEAVLSK
jgi:hypothetical protein